MTILNAGDITTVIVSAIDAIKFTATSGAGMLIPINQDGTPGTPVPVDGSATQYGAFGVISRYRINCISGVLSYEISRDNSNLSSSLKLSLDASYALAQASNSEVRDFARRNTAPLPALYINEYDKLITRLKSGATSSSNIFGKIDGFYIFAAPSAQAACLNLKGTTLGGTATPQGAPVFVPGRGYYFNGNGDYLDLGFTPLQGVNFAQDSAFIMARGENPLEGQSTNLIGLASSNLVGINPRATTTNTIAGRINSGTAEAGAAVTNAQGYVAINRTGATTTQMYKNASASGSPGSSVSTTRASSNFCVARGNGAYYTGQIQFAVIAAGLTAAEITDLINACDAYLTAIGFASLSYVESTRSIISATTLPDGASASDAGKGWTTTGLTRLPDLTLLVGNHGKATTGAASFDSSVVHLSADKQRILHEWKLSAMAGVTVGSVQGVSYEYINSGGVLFNLYFVVTGVGAYMVPISTLYVAGTPVFLGYVTDINGIVYDSVRRVLSIICNTPASPFLFTRSKSDVTIPATGGLGTFKLPNSSGADWDMVWQDVASDNFYLTFGANGSNGRVYRYNISDVALYGGPFPREQITVTGAVAIEGTILNLDGTTFSVSNDAHYHSTGNDLNQIIVF